MQMHLNGQVGDQRYAFYEIANGEQLDSALALIERLKQPIGGLTVQQAAEAIGRVMESDEAVANFGQPATAVEPPVLIAALTITSDPATLTRQIVNRKGLGIAAATKLLAEHGAKRASELPDDRKAAYIEAAVALLAATPEVPSESK